VKAGDARDRPGSWVGLYICRELVQLHGGNIFWVESDPAREASFALSCPGARSRCARTLLLVDDDPDVLEVFRHLLAAEQYKRPHGP